jgi:2',3'-cyclic-nucleotide 2'-phosphodiesterase (5'-nucleotidase family)
LAVPTSLTHSLATHEEVRRDAPQLAQIVTGIALTLALAAPAVAATSALQPDKLIILSTTDMKGKTLPCGCHVPKGGIARQVGFADSVRQLYSNVVRVDGGGFFPRTTRVPRRRGS